MASGLGKDSSFGDPFTDKQVMIRNKLRRVSAVSSCLALFSLYW